MKKINFLLTILFVPFVFFGQSNDSISIKKILDEVSVNAIRAKTNTPIAFTNLNKQQIKKSNLGQSKFIQELLQYKQQLMLRKLKLVLSRQKTLIT